MAETQKQDSRPHGTREQIVLVAEKMFAKGGIDEVSLRQITIASGQKNASAIQYHFGSKDALIEAIYDLRMATVNARRKEILDELELLGNRPVLRDLVDAVVRPLAEQLTARKPRSFYVQFVAQTIDHPKYFKVAWGRGRAGTAFEKIFDRMEQLLPNVPPEVFSQRFGMMLRQVFGELAAHDKLHLTTRQRASVNTGLVVENLIDSISAALAAPVSPATLRQFKRSGQKQTS